MSERNRYTVEAWMEASLGKELAARFVMEILRRGMSNKVAHNLIKSMVEAWIENRLQIRQKPGKGFS